MICFPPALEWAMTVSGVSSNARNVLYTLASFARQVRQEWHVTLDDQELQLLTGLSQPDLASSLQQLQAEGWIRDTSLRRGRVACQLRP